MEKFKEYAFGGGSIGSYKPMADLGDYDNLHAAEEKKITQSDLDQIEKYADRLFASLDIDVEFTRHFMDRVNDARNIKQITVAELIRLFKQAYRRHGKKIAKLPDQANAVINDMKTNINLPFVLKYKKGEIELVAKTVMRKKNFTTSASSPKLSFESLQHKLDEAFPVQVTVKDKKGKTHTTGTRDLRGATHALLIHYKEIPASTNKMSLNYGKIKPAKTEIFLGTEGELAKTAKRMLKQHPSKKYATGAEVVKLDKKMVKGATLSETNEWGELTEKAEYDGRPVDLNNPTEGDRKKYKVYVRNDKGNVVKVEFGDPNMEIKRDSPGRLKAFRARHQCDTNPGPKWKARYLSLINICSCRRTTQGRARG